MDQDGLCRIVTDRDIVCRAVAIGLGPDAPVTACMSREPLTCRTTDTLYEAIELMMQQQVRRLVVLNLDGTPVGMLAQADVAAAMASYGLAGELLQRLSRPGGQHCQG